MVEFCEKCKEYLWGTKKCQCKEFLIIDKEFCGDEPISFWCVEDDEEGAAEAYAKRNFDRQDQSMEWNIVVNGIKMFVEVIMEPTFNATKASLVREWR